MKRELLIIAVIMVHCVCNIDVWAEDRTKTGKSVFLQTLNIKNMDMRQLAQILSCGGKWKIVVSEDAAEIKIRDTYLENVYLEDALRAVCRAYNVWYRKDPDSGIITLLTLDEYTSGISQYDSEIVKVITLHYPDAVEVAYALQQLFRNRVIWEKPYSKDNDDIIDDIELPLDIMDIFADRTQFASIASKSSSSTNSDDDDDDDDSSSDDYNRNPSLMEDFKLNIKKELLLDKLMSAKEKELDANLGQPGLVYLSVLEGSNELLIRSNDADAIMQFEEIISQLDKPKPQVLLEVKVLEVDLDDESAFGIDWFFEGGDYSGGRGAGLNDFEQSSSFSEILEPSSSLVPQGSGLDARAFVFEGITKDIRVRLQMLEENNSVRCLATPTLCVAHNEASKIFIGKETTVLTSVDVETSIVGDSDPVQTTTVDPTTERNNIGTSLLITPQIHADRTATIRIVQEESSLGDMQTIQYSDTDSFQSQDIDSTSVITTILAADGNISLIGGLIQNIETEQTIGIPFLMDLPFIGSLFKTEERVKNSYELVILIRPFILVAPGEAEEASRALTSRLITHPSTIQDVPAALMNANAPEHFKEDKLTDDELENLKSQTDITITE